MPRYRKSKPTVSDVHVNQALTDVAVGFFQQEDVSVWDKVFPIVSSARKSNSYHVWDVGDLTRVEAGLRGAGAHAAEAGIGLTQATYSAEVYALRSPIDDQEADNADEAVMLEESKAMYVSSNVSTRIDKLFAANFFTSGKWTTEPTPADWDTASGDPVFDIADAKDTVRRLTGFEPNVLVVGAAVHTALKNNDDIKERIKHTFGGAITSEMLAALFEVDRYVVGKGMETTSAEGAASRTAADIFGNHALLAYAAPAPSRDVPSGGYSFVWDRPGSGPNGMRMLDYMEEPHTRWLEAEIGVDLKLVAADLGAFFLDIVT